MADSDRRAGALEGFVLLDGIKDLETLVAQQDRGMSEARFEVIDAAYRAGEIKTFRYGYRVRLRLLVLRPSSPRKGR